MADIYLFLQDSEHDECDLGCERHWVLVFHYKSEGRIIMYDCDSSSSGYTLHRVREQIPPICRDIRLVVCDFPVTPEEMENAARENMFNGHLDSYDNYEEYDANNSVCIKWAKTLCASRGIPFRHISKCKETPGEAYAVDAEGNFVCEAEELFHHYFVSEFELS